jgi:hypothetical protein
LPSHSLVYAATVAGKVGVTEDEAHEVLGELCDGTYAISKWRERDARDEEELPS